MKITSEAIDKTGPKKRRMRTHKVESSRGQEDL